MIGRETFMLIIHSIGRIEWPDHGEEGFEEPEIEVGSNFVCSGLTWSRTITEVMTVNFPRDEAAPKIKGQSYWRYPSIVNAGSLVHVALWKRKAAEKEKTDGLVPSPSRCRFAMLLSLAPPFPSHRAHQVHHRDMIVLMQ